MTLILEFIMLLTYIYSKTEKLTKKKLEVRYWHTSSDID